MVHLIESVASELELMVAMTTGYVVVGCGGVVVYTLVTVVFRKWNPDDVAADDNDDGDEDTDDGAEFNGTIGRLVGVQLADSDERLNETFTALEVAAPENVEELATARVADDEDSELGANNVVDVPNTVALDVVFGKELKTVGDEETVAVVDPSADVEITDTADVDVDIADVEVESVPAVPVHVGLTTPVDPPTPLASRFASAFLSPSMRAWLYSSSQL
jgi:hypothetical protein